MRLFTRSVRFAIRYFALGLVLAGALACAGAASATPDLMKNATKLVPEPVTGTSNVDHPWVSDHEVLYVKNGGLWLFDTDKKTNTKLSKLSDEVFAGIGYLVVEVSPARNCVAWCHSNSGWETAQLDGSDVHEWPAPYLNQVDWCADGKYWVRVDQSAVGGYHFPSIRAVFYQATDPPAKRGVYPLPAGLRPLDILAIPTPTTVIARIPDLVRDIPQNPKGHPEPGGGVGFSFMIQETFRPVQTVSEWDLSTGEKTGEWVIRLPANVQEVAASPDGKRIAWLVAAQLAGKAFGGMSIWVSNIDGTGLHEIGSSGSDGANFANMIDEIQWVPGDKAISFHSDYWLYEVPAP